MNEIFCARSCDSLTLPSRDGMIESLRKGEPRTLVHLGDSIYADHGFVTPDGLATEWVEQYVRAWTDTFAALVPITATCFNVLLPDDHEVWDNFDRDNMREHEKIGFALLCKLYEEWMGPFRRSLMTAQSAVDPYDNYAFTIGATRFAVLGRGLSNSAAFLVNAKKANVEAFVVLAQKAHLRIAPTTLASMYYALKRQSPIYDTGADAWAVLSECGNVTLVAGDLHESIHDEQFRGVHLVVSSPFSNVSHGAPNLVAGLNGELDDRPNFVTLRHGRNCYVAEFTRGPKVGWCEWFTSIGRQV